MSLGEAYATALTYLGERDSAEVNRKRRIENRDVMTRWMKEAAADGRKLTMDEVASMSEEVSNGMNWVDRAFPVNQINESMLANQNRKADETMRKSRTEAMVMDEQIAKIGESWAERHIENGGSISDAQQKFAETFGEDAKHFRGVNPAAAVKKAEQRQVENYLTSAAFKNINNESDIEVMISSITNPNVKNQVKAVASANLKKLQEDGERKNFAEMVQGIRGEDLITLKNDAQLMELVNSRATSQGIDPAKMDQGKRSAIMTELRAKRDAALREFNLKASSQSHQRTMEGLARLGAIRAEMNEPEIRQALLGNNIDAATKSIIGKFRSAGLALDETEIRNVLMRDRIPMQMQDYAAKSDAGMKSALAALKAENEKVKPLVLGSFQAAASQVGITDKKSPNYGMVMGVANALAAQNDVLLNEEIVNKVAKAVVDEVKSGRVKNDTDLVMNAVRAASSMGGQSGSAYIENYRSKYLVSQGYGLPPGTNTQRVVEGLSANATEAMERIRQAVSENKLKTKSARDATIANATRELRDKYERIIMSEHVLSEPLNAEQKAQIKTAVDSFVVKAQSIMASAPPPTPEVPAARQQQPGAKPQPTVYTDSKNGQRYIIEGGRPVYLNARTGEPMR